MNYQVSIGKQVIAEFSDKERAEQFIANELDKDDKAVLTEVEELAE